MKLSLQAFLWHQQVLGLQRVLVNPAAEHQLLPLFKLLYVNHIDLLHHWTQAYQSCATVFIEVDTHRLSSVSLFASLADWTRSTRSTWSTRRSSRTSVTTITLQETSKRVGRIRGSLNQYVVVDCNMGVVPTLTPRAPSLPGGPSAPGFPCQMTSQQVLITSSTKSLPRTMNPNAIQMYT